MAEKEGYKFVEDPAEELTCSICTKVLCEPHLMNCCGQQFCKDCLEKWLQKNTTCPHCHSADFSHIFMQSTSRKIRELKVYCPNNQHGCKAVLKMSECEEHLSTTNDRGCAYVRLKCPNACTAEPFRGEMDAHTLMECPKRTVVCPHCDLRGEHQHIVGDHENECPLYPLPCPQGCEDTVLRKDLEAHRDTCPLEPVSCPLHELGCKTTVCRKDLERHVETSTIKHMTVLAKSHTALQAEHTALQAECTALNAGHATLQAELQAEHTALQAEHTALQAEHTALRKSYSAKMEAIGRVGFSYDTSDSLQLAQIHTILADSSYVKLGDTVCLALSESNEKSGQHHFVLSHLKPLPELGFRLEWELEDVAATIDQRQPINKSASRLHLEQRPSWMFKLYSITDLSVTVKSHFGVEICFSQWMEEPGGVGKPVLLASVCCGRPVGLPLVFVGGSAQLIGMLSLTCREQKSKQISVRFSVAGCECQCHYK